MNQQNTTAPDLFDLLARQWQRPSPVGALCFNTEGSAVAFASLDGTIAIAATADREPPDERIRVSSDVGRTTIGPRTAPVVPLITTATTAADQLPLAAYGQSDFLVGTASGSVVRLMADGDAAGTLGTLGGAILVLDHCATTGTSAAATQTAVFLSRGAGDWSALEAASPVSAIAFSPDGGTLALGGEGAVSLRSIGGGTVGTAREIALPERCVSLSWSADGGFLACGLESSGFALLRMADGRSGVVGGYPAPVGSLCWSSDGDTLVTSGAFRTTGWSMRPPPFDGDLSGAVETGRAGVVLIETAAAHPQKPLVAAGYANGQIVVAKIGARDELLVRPQIRSRDGGVTALAWSRDGRHLAAGTADGTAAIITFPPQMFK